MSSAHQIWIERVPGFPGLLGACVMAPQQEPEIRSWSEDFTADGIRTLQRQVADVLEVLDAGQMPARKLRWIFERTVVYFERRRDGAGMCLITTHDPWAGESEIITKLIADFRDAD
jgi:hypothetical protein